MIGRRPIASFGNSDGDLQMLQWTCLNDGARFCLIVHHTDTEREWAYDRKSSRQRFRRSQSQRLDCREYEGRLEDHFSAGDEVKRNMNNREAFQQIAAAMNAAVIGQETVVERLLIAFLADGHVLMEGLPGVAKPRSIKTLSKLVESDFRRVQFTPDLLPSDVTGSEIYREQNGSFDFQRGPIFGNLVLAD